MENGVFVSPYADALRRKFNAKLKYFVVAKK